MGLDMYLTKKTYLYGDSRIGLKLTLKGSAIKPERVKWIAEEVGYWRKANAVHQWFVDNVQNGEDNCDSYEVSAEQLRQLLELVREVLKDNSRASKLLPTQSGFFFGTTEYDEGYFDDLKLTAEMLGAVLADEGLTERISIDEPSSFIEYRSSW